MKILFVNYEYPPWGGGGGIANKTLADELAEKNEVCVLTSGCGWEWSCKKEGSITVYRVPAFFRKSKEVSTFISLTCFCIFGFLRGILLKKKNYDVVHSFFALPSGIVGLFLSKLFSKKHVLTVIGMDIYEPTKKLSPNNNLAVRRLVSEIIRKSDCVTAISTDIAQRAKSLAESHNKIYVVPISIDPPPSGIKKQKRDNSIFRLITIARLVPRKNLANLLGAIGDLRGEKVELIIIGDGPEKEKLKLLSEKLKISDKVEFAGFISEKEKYELLASSDCFVLTSLHEGFGLVYLEAMSLGLPVIAGCVGGQRDFLENEKTGYLVAVNDYKLVSNKIKKLMKKKSTVKEISKYNINKAKMYYAANVSREYEKIYKKALA